MDLVNLIMNLSYLLIRLKKYKIPLDPIYTGKVLFGIFTLIKNHNWSWGKNILFIHTGGLQGIDGFNFLQKKKGGLLLK